MGLHDDTPTWQEIHDVLKWCVNEFDPLDPSMLQSTMDCTALIGMEMWDERTVRDGDLCGVRLANVPSRKGMIVKVGPADLTEFTVDKDSRIVWFKLRPGVQRLIIIHYNKEDWHERAQRTWKR